MTQVSIAHLRHLIRTLSYFVSTHAADELEDDNLSILDLENIILTGQITERQRDRTADAARRTGDESDLIFHATSFFASASVARS